MSVPVFRRVAALLMLDALLVGIIAFGLLPRDEAAASTTVLSIIDGGAQVGSGGTFSAASDGQILRDGDQVRTEAASHAVITFFDGSTIEIEPNTTLRVEAAGTRDGAVVILIQQTLGRTWSSVHRFLDPGSRYEVRTPSAVAAVRGTGFVTAVDAAGDTVVEATDGAVTVQAQAQEVLVTAGTLTTVTSGRPPSTPAPAPAPTTRLVVGIRSAAYLALIDPVGRTCGVVLPGPSVVRQIPGCLVDGPDDPEPRRVSLPDAIGGTYRVVASGQADGSIVVQAALYTGSALTANVAATTTIAMGEKKAAPFTLDPSAATLSELGAFEVHSAPLRGVPPARGPQATASATGETGRLQPSLPPLGQTPSPSASEPTSEPSGTPVVTEAPTPTPTRSALPSPTATPTNAPTPTPPPSATPSPTIPPTPTTSPDPSPTATGTPEPKPSPSRLEVSAPKEVVAGAVFAVTVTIYDQFGKVIPFDGLCFWDNLTASLSPGTCTPFRGGQSVTQATISKPLLGDQILISGAGLDHSQPIDVLDPRQPSTSTPSPSSAPPASAAPSSSPTPPLPTPSQ